MAQATQVHPPDQWTNPAILRWGRRRMGLGIEEAGTLSGVDSERIAQYESGSAIPGLEALENLAEVYRCPVGYFFLDSPPELAFSLSMRGLRERKLEALHYDTHVRLEQFLSLTDLAARLVEVIGARREVNIGRVDPSEPIVDVATRERECLGITAEVRDRWNGPEAAFQHWKRAIEAKGVIVISLKLDPSDVRGASRWEHPSVPAILVNREDAEAATGRAFTLLHEWAHLLTRSSGLVCDFEGHREGVHYEAFANALAAEMLVPQKDLLALLRKLNLLEPRDTWSDYMLDKVRLPFGASRHVVALLLEQLDLVPKGFYASKRAIWEQRQPYFRATTVRRTGHTKRQRRLTALGAPLISLLSQAHENGAMSKLDLAEVLDMKVEQVEDFGSWVRDEWRRQGD